MSRSTVQKVLWGGGIAVGVLLVVLGGIWIWQGVAARNEVHDTIAQEQIVGSEDMSPANIQPAIAEAGLTGEIAVPSCDVAGKAIDNGSDARCFAEYMRVHALESSGGRTYSEMGRFLTPSGDETSNPAEAAQRNGQPVSNPARDLWVTQRALATGLELAYVGEQVSLFSIATGVVFALVGIGLLVMLTVGGVLRGSESAASSGGATTTPATE